MGGRAEHEVPPIVAPPKNERLTFATTFYPQFSDQRKTYIYIYTYIEHMCMYIILDAHALSMYIHVYAYVYVYA